MAAPPPSVLTFNGAFYLPVVLLALLSGLVASFALPIVPTFSVSSLEFALLTQLLQLWSPFLSWFTRPCLFVILNGIIVTLSATSGMLSSSASGAASSDFCPKLLSKMPSHPKKILGDPVEILAYRVSFIANLSIKKHSVDNPLATMSSLSTSGPCVVLDAHGAFQEEELQFYEAEDESQANGEVEYSHEVSRLGLESESLSFRCNNYITGEKEEGDDEHEYGNELDDEHDNGNKRDNEDASQDLEEKTVALAYREEGKYVQMTSRSVPCSPRFAKPPKPISIKRSLSIDSTIYQTAQALPDFLSAESLSDEAFGKKVEDFISKMNAQLRKEVK